MSKETMTERPPEPYRGFEQGPIRPPSEAGSLLIRVTRNCPWNRCTFCPVYKGSKFSLRPVEHVKQDIEAVHGHVQHLMDMAGQDGYLSRSQIQRISQDMPDGDVQAFQAALHWLAGGMASIFLQDANSLIIKPDDLVDVLEHLKSRFPWVKRITSYARSHTIARISDADMHRIARAGLNRIHIGMESASDQVLEKIKKGVTKNAHIQAGLKVKNAGIELSEYVMPGLGGRALSREHALETADALNQINPDFIRLRTLAIPNSVALFKEWESGEFQKCTDREMAQETLLFLEALAGITSTIKSDHILNLFEDVEGRLPEDKARMIGTVKAFLQMPPETQARYQVGRRLGIFRHLSDMNKPHLMNQVEETCRKMGITADNVDATIDEVMKRFI